MNASTVIKVLGITSALMMAAGVRADFILDQSNPGPANVAYSIGNGQYEAQTFTVGISGTLSEVDAKIQTASLNQTGSLILEVVTTFGGLPYLSGSVPGSILASETIPIYFGNSYSLTDLSIPVTTGEQLAIVWTSDNATSSIAGLFQYAPSYNGGQGFANGSGQYSGTWFAQDGSFLFNTYVNTPLSTPEPSSFALTVLGVACLAAWYGYRRRMALAARFGFLTSC